MRSKVDLCMFCEEAPCVCNKPAKKNPSPRKPKSKPVSSEVPEQAATILPPASPPTVNTEAVRLAMKAAVEESRPTVPRLRQADLKAKAIAEAVKENDDDEQHELTRCLVVLEGIMHPDELRVQESLLNSLVARSYRWRLRNGRG